MSVTTRKSQPLMPEKQESNGLNGVYKRYSPHYVDHDGKVFSQEKSQRIQQEFYERQARPLYQEMLV